MSAVSYGAVPRGAAPRGAAPRGAVARAVAVVDVPARATRVRALPAAASRSHLRMTARGRAVLLILIATPVVILALILGTSGGGATATGSSTPLSTVTVLAGQSLWQIAGKVAPAADPRDVIAGIMSVNNLRSTEVQPGERLEIPAQYAASN